MLWVENLHVRTFSDERILTHLTGMSGSCDEDREWLCKAKNLRTSMRKFTSLQFVSHIYLNSLILANLESILNHVIMNSGVLISHISIMQLMHYA